MKNILCLIIMFISVVFCFPFSIWVNLLIFIGVWLFIPAVFLLIIYKWPKNGEINNKIEE